MNTAGRIVAAVVGLLLAFAAYLTISTNAWFPITITLGSIEVTGALLAFWFTLLGHNASERFTIARVLQIGVIVGAVGFVAGFVGPIIFSPGANQGPLLGIFGTGPLGFVAGCILGFIWTRCRHAPAIRA